MSRRRITLAVAAAGTAVGLGWLAPAAHADSIVGTTSNDVVCVAHRTIDVGACVDDSAVVLARRLVEQLPPP